MPAPDSVLAGPVGPILAVVAMAVATFLCRIAGVLLMSRIRITPVMERALAALPGSIVAATVVPIAIGSGPAAIAGVAAAIGAMRLVGNELAALAAGLAVAAGARALGL